MTGHQRNQGNRHENEPDWVRPLKALLFERMEIPDSDVHWLEDQMDTIADSEDYCLGCATLYANAYVYLGKPDVMVCGGGGSGYECNTPPHCGRCGQKLDYGLSCPVQELQHFRDYCDALDFDDPDCCYDLYQTLDAIDYRDDCHVLLLADLEPLALAIGHERKTHIFTYDGDAAQLTCWLVPAWPQPERAPYSPGDICEFRPPCEECVSAAKLYCRRPWQSATKLLCDSHGRGYEWQKPLDPVRRTIRKVTSMPCDDLPTNEVGVEVAEWYWCLEFDDADTK